MAHREISDKKFQIDALDGLRGFAALMVVFSHTSNKEMFYAPFLDLTGIGKPGVFLFFLLSSFLLTLPLLRKGKEAFTLPAMSHYWKRRFLRIYPLYTCYLLLGLVSTWVITAALNKQGVGVPFGLDWYGFVNHMALLEGKGVTWSIAVEFKFYFILPLMVLATLLVRPYGPVLTTTFFAALLLLSQILSPQSEALPNDTRLLPYMPIFVIGIFLAVLQDYINSNKSVMDATSTKKLLSWLGFLGVFGVIFMTPAVYSIFVEKVPAIYFHNQFILSTILFSFILFSSVNVNGLLQRFFSLPILRFYGAISFSLYLFHPIFINLVEKLGLNGYVSAWLVLLCSTVAAYISFRFLEAPMSKFTLKGKPKIAEKQTLPASD